MAPNKFEDNIKDKLEQRVIKPSADSWAILENKLDAKPQKKTNKSIWFLGIAASFIGVLLLTNVLIKNQTNFIPNSPTVVEVENPTETISDNQIVIQFKNQIQEEIIDDPVNTLNNDKQIVEEKNFSKSPVLKKSIVKTHEVVVQNKTNVNLNNHIEKDKTASFQPKIEEPKIAVIAEIQNIKKNSHDVLDTEIETLMQQAKNEVTAQTKTTTVDANSLLQDVEADLEQSFRDKVFETLKTNFIKVKTAVADRNN